MTPRFSLLALIAINLLGCYMILDSFIRHQRDAPGCQMSYSRPSFIHIPVPQSRLAAKYSLYLYREGGIDSPSQLQGVPTLFIPGHAGSYKQGRSIAAESAYYYQGLPSKNYRYGLDVFTVDLNEEFSAIDGGLIQDQAEYLNDATKKILSFYQPIAEYQGRPVPKSVLVVGHSMGGIVARVMQHLPNYETGSINTIFTLATPHSIPPIILDSTLDEIYRHSLSQPLNNTVLISLAGGTQDTIVNSDAAILSPSPSALTVFTTAIPGVWTGCDHMAILWCNQLVKKVAAALVDITDIRSPSQTVPANDRMHIFKSYLSPPQSAVMDSEWKTPNLSASSIYIDGTKPQYLQPQNGQQLVFTLNKHIGDMGIITNIQHLNLLRVRLCKTDADNLGCSSVKSGFHILPSPTKGKTQPFEHNESPLWLLNLEYDFLKDFDILVMDYEQENLNKDHFIRTGMYASTTNQGIEKFGLSSFWELAFNKGALLEVDSQQYLGSVFHFPEIKSPLLAFKLSVVGNSSSFFSKPSSSKTYQPLVKQSFYGESKFHILSNDQISAPIHLHRGQPLNGNDKDSTDGLILTVWPLSHDHGPIHLLLKLDWYGSIGKSVLRLGPALPMCLFVVTLSFMSHQLSSLSPDRRPCIDLAGSLMAWLTNRGKYSFLNLCILVVLVTCIQQAWPEQMDSEWLVGNVYHLPTFLWGIPLALFILAAGLLMSISVILSLLVYVLQWIMPSSTSSRPRFAYTNCAVWIVLISCLSWLPISIVVMVIYLQWLFLCAASYSSARLSNSTSDWIKYRCQFAVFMVLTTWLPYHIPRVIVYIRDLMVGWHYSASLTSILCDMDVIVALGLLYTIGWCDSICKSSTSMAYLSKISYGFALYYTVLGIQRPFTLRHLVTSIFSYIVPLFYKYTI
ncbi:PGAP1-like protein-domain-containing protein [Absidia repens]|uniref:GPI inositol-deacylase n=1 Tax=Absidia repens TaxID=90262 RepID=A0A1X2I856_9FUNG|nr:PGAP1-like protein-domain-containing protein [Absidia repens]